MPAPEVCLERMDGGVPLYVPKPTTRIQRRWAQDGTQRAKESEAVDGQKGCAFILFLGDLFLGGEKALQGTCHRGRLDDGRGHAGDRVDIRIAN